MREAGLRGGRARGVFEEVRNPMPPTVVALRVEEACAYGGRPFRGVDAGRWPATGFCFYAW